MTGPLFFLSDATNPRDCLANLHMMLRQALSAAIAYPPPGAQHFVRFFAFVAPLVLHFWAQVGLGGWPSGLTRPSDQSTTSRYLLPERINLYSKSNYRRM